MGNPCTIAFMGNLAPLEWILILALLVLILSLTRRLWEPDLIAWLKDVQRFLNGN